MGRNIAVAGLLSLIGALGWDIAVKLHIIRVVPVESQRPVPAVAGWRQLALDYGWKLDYAAALADARQDNKPMMVVFRCVP